MNERQTRWAASLPVATPARGCLDNVTELLQATGVARSRQRPAPARLLVPSRAVGGLGEVMAALARQARVIVPRTVVGHRRARSAAGSLLDRLPLVTPAPALGPVGAECRPTR